MEWHVELCASEISSFRSLGSYVFFHLSLKVLLGATQFNRVSEQLCSNHGRFFSVKAVY